MKNTLIGATLLFCIITGCSSEDENPSSLPIACFESPASAEAGVAISFNAACSQNAAGFNWNFGDGNTSTQQNPEHTYGFSGIYEVKLTVTGTTGETDVSSITIDVADAPASAVTNHFGTVTQDEIWEAGIHRIFGVVNIADATVTIMPGAIIKFTEGAELTVGVDDGVTTATLIANGTATQPIIFTADSDTPTNGFWDVIKFGSGSSGNSSFSYCTIEYGGGTYNEDQMIYVNGTTISMDHSIVRNSSTIGIELSETAAFQSFTNNEISNCDLFVMEVHPNNVPSLESSNNFITDTGISISGGTISSPNAFWKKQSVPYVVSGIVYVESDTGTTLTIDPGTNIKFKEFTSLNIGSSLAKPAKLIAEGTDIEPIVFDLFEENAPGANWKGINFRQSNDPASSLKHCHINAARGGTTTGQYAAIHVRSTSVNINNCIISNAGYHGIRCDEEGSFSSFENNSIENAAINGIVIFGGWVHTLGNTNTITATAREIEVQAGTISQQAVTWKKQPYPYYVHGRVEVGSETGSTLTIEAGTTIAFSGGFSLDVGFPLIGKSAIGHLIAIGTQTEPILFTSGKDAPATGDYERIEVSGNSIMDYCIVEYGSKSTTDGSIMVSSDNVTVKNSTIRNSKGYGIYVDKSSPTFENNTFIDNGNMDYYYSL